MSWGLGRHGVLTAVVAFLVGISGVGADAADWGARDLVFSETSLYRPDRWELRAGGFAQCCYAEKGFTFGAEVVSLQLFLIPDLPEIFSPRFHSAARSIPTA